MLPTASITKQKGITRNRYLSHSKVYFSTCMHANKKNQQMNTNSISIKSSNWLNDPSILNNELHSTVIFTHRYIKQTNKLHSTNSLILTTVILTSTTTEHVQCDIKSYLQAGPLILAYYALYSQSDPSNVCSTGFWIHTGVTQACLYLSNQPVTPKAWHIPFRLSNRNKKFSIS